jgi:ATP-dependent DNA helicase RecG
MSSEMFRITNPGGLYGVTLASLGELELTSARNRQLIDMCRFLRTQDGRAVEALATGILTVFEEVALAGFRPPRFHDNAISFTAILTSQLLTTPTDGAKRSPRPLSPGGAAIVAILQGGPASASHIAQQLGIHRSAAIRRLQRLITDGVIASTGSQGVQATYRLPDR